MDVRADGRKCYDVDADALVVAIYEGEDTSDALLEELDTKTGGLLAELLGSGELRGKLGDTVYLYNIAGIKARRLLLVGVGKRDEYDFDTMRQIAGTAARFLRAKGVRTVAAVRRARLDLARSAEAFVEGVLLGLYEPDVYRTEEREERRIEALVLCTSEGGDSDELARGVERGRIMAEATNFARSLVNEPSNNLTPSLLADRAVEMAERSGLDIDVLDEARVKELGMGAFLGVARGSDEPARMVVLRYMHAEAPDDRTIALVGKGITFDTGGISIKPAEGMEKMKYDMAGAAAVFGAMHAIARLKPKVNVIGVAPLTENMPSGRAYKPGDVLRSLSGRTIEVLNTDAEGRLILCDAIAYARRLGATEVIDVATLTGAVSVALGSVNAAILGTDDRLVEEIVSAGKRSGERFWRLPLDIEYAEMVKSDIADLRNSTGRAAGTITAAHFLREFAEETPWAHLDIAGTAWQGEKRAHVAKGPSGFAVRTLASYVASWS